MVNLENEAPTKNVGLSDKEASYLRGNKTPIAGSLLLSTSKYLNNPLFRDLFAQQGLKKMGSDVPAAYLIPDIQKVMDEVTDYPAVFAGLESARKRLPEFAQWLDARFVSNLQPDDVKDCPPGTLGAHVHDFISKSGMQIDFMYLDAPKNDFEYMNKRRIQTHDILHMVTGLDTSPVGEAALNVANIVAEAKYFGDDELFGNLNRGALFLVTTNLMRSACHYPAVVPALFDGYARGHALGSKQKKPLFMINWEPYFSWQVSDIREEFSFQDGPPEGTWDWTFMAVSEPA